MVLLAVLFDVLFLVHASLCVVATLFSIITLCTIDSVQRYLYWIKHTFIVSSVDVSCSPNLSVYLYLYIVKLA